MKMVFGNRDTWTWMNQNCLLHLNQCLTRCICFRKVFVLFHFHICAALPINLNCGNIILMFGKNYLKDDPRRKDIAF